MSVIIVKIMIHKTKQHDIYKSGAHRGGGVIVYHGFPTTTGDKGYPPGWL